MRYSLEVYDRWGNEVYEKTDATSNKVEDGWQPGEKYNTGVFSYWIQYTDKEEEKGISGMITVVK